MVVQGLRLNVFTAEGPGSIPGQGTKILQAALHSQEQNQKTKNKNGKSHTSLICKKLSKTKLNKQKAL